MNTRISVSIGGTAPNLPYMYAKISQGLYTHCEMLVEFVLNNPDQRQSLFDSAVSSWMGSELVLTVYDLDNPSIQKPYKGTITGVGLQSGRLRVRAFSEDYFLSHAHKHRAFEDKSAFDVASQLIRGAIGQNDIAGPASSLNFKFLQQYDETDYEFLKRLAHLDGCVFFHDGEKFYYQPSLSGTATARVEDAGYEVSDAELTCSLGLKNFQGAPYNYIAHQDSSALPTRSGNPTLPGHPYMQDVHTKSQSLFPYPSEEHNQPLPLKPDFEQYMKNQQAFNAGLQIGVTGKTQHPMVAVGRAIESPNHPILKDPFVVVKMEAVFVENVYTAYFDAAQQDSIVRPVKEGNGREYMGLIQPADVISNTDPEVLGRVQIRYLWDNGYGSNAWARVVEAGAGSGYGTHYTPRVGDQVIVACEHGDPSLPIILGALYHSDHKPDFVTNNGTEEVLVVKTPGESTIRLVDTGGSEEIIISMKNNKNLIHLELNGPKITVESVDGTVVVHSKMIEINADDKITMSAQEIEITAQKNMKTTVGQNQSTSVGQDMTVKVGGKSEEQITMEKNVTAGTKIVQKAGTQAEIQAGVAVKINAAQVESTAAATNVIKGALVQIN